MKLAFNKQMSIFIRWALAYEEAVKARRLLQAVALLIELPEEVLALGLRLSQSIITFKKKIHIFFFTPYKGRGSKHTDSYFLCLSTKALEGWGHRRGTSLSRWSVGQFTEMGVSF